MEDADSSKNCVILDACCIINLYASRHMEEILTSINRRVAVAEYVLNEEALTVYSGPLDDVRQASEQIDLHSLVGGGLIDAVSLDFESEADIFISLATKLDDGEALTGAIAVHRGWAIATDDRKARTIFTKHFPQISLVSTLDIVKYWADSRHVEKNAISATLRDIATRANYEPSPKHELYEWWQKFRAE